MPVDAAASVGAALKAAREDTDPRVTQEQVMVALRERGFSTSLSTYQRWEATGKVGAAELFAVLEILEVEPGDFQRAVQRLVTASSGGLRADVRPGPPDPDDVPSSRTDPPGRGGGHSGPRRPTTPRPPRGRRGR